ncbi:MAG: beta-hydroxyacyl-ACP dehydratase [Planctomycetes bacterium]|nr:beta-hydroxyacyl-ACP dehydratase [Planctomycetota bacterium]
MERAEIEALIPHRAPFLFVDRVIERTHDGLVTEWRVDEQAFFFRGHYPGFPLLPGVLICEAAVQAGAVLAALEPRDATAPGQVPVLVKLGEARFRRMVRPGETLRFAVTLDERIGPARLMTARVTSAGKNVARVGFTVAVTSTADASGGELG